ncbi:phosphotransferase [Clostridiaceae bacterium M8S5]|nr:phosphotransferase [Clostridiaceae bacterium M8S5]
MLQNFKFDELIECINNTYNISVLNIEEINMNWGSRLCCKVKSHEERFFLKEKPFYLDKKEFEHALEIYSIFETKGVKIANIKRTMKHKLTFNFSNRIFCLIKWLDGDKLWYIKESNNYFELGETCACLACASMELPKGEVTIPLCREEQLLDITENSINMLFEVLKKNFCAERYSFNKKIVEFERKLIKQYNSINWDKFEYSWLHGDFHGNNVIKNKGNQLYIIDYDDLFWGYRLIDLVWCCVIHSVWILEKLKIRNSIDYSIMKNIVKGYKKRIKLSEAEKASFDFVFRVLILRSLIEMFSLTDETVKVSENVKNDFSKSVIKILNILENYEHKKIIKEIIEKEG